MADRFDLVPVHANVELARFFAHDARENGASAWQKGRSFTSTLCAIKRHMFAFERGQDVDGDTGLKHLTHIAGLSVALMEHCHFNPECDDRYLAQRAPRCAVEASLFINACAHEVEPRMQPLALFSFARDISDMRICLDRNGFKSTPLLQAYDPANLAELLKMMEVQVIVTWDSLIWSTMKGLGVNSALVSHDADLRGLAMVYKSLDAVPWLNPR